MLVLRRIRVHYRVTAPAESADTIARVHGIHKDYCPVYRSIKAAIEVTTTFERR